MTAGPLAAAVRRLMAERRRGGEWELGHADRLGALFAGWDLWSCWFLRPDGAVVVVGEDMDGPETDSAYTDRARRLSGLSGAARLYPELAALVPARPADAADCRCVGVAVFALGKVICPECGGVGWLPAGPP